MAVRVRFAPSPTGYLHIGGARTALFNWLFARQQQGTFLLRIEDTDEKRSRSEMVDGILEGLSWLGLNWDEGPFFQSERIDLYRATADRILALGLAYRDFGAADSEERHHLRFRSLPAEESLKMAESGIEHAIRFKVPESQQVSFTDLVYGPIAVDSTEIEDFVILRSDGNPTYHLSVVTDDVEMGITHVIRGADHLSNTGKHILLYQALGQPCPVYAHLPLILGPDKKRLSKRHGATSVTEYMRQGLLPGAVRNYLALLGWSTGDSTEFLSDEELIRRFDLARINRANAVFDFEKLEWMNKRWLSAMSADELAPMVEVELRRSGFWQDAWAGDDRPKFTGLIDLLKTRVGSLLDFPEYGRPFFAQEFLYEEEAANRHLAPQDPEVRRALAAAVRALTEAYTAVAEFNLVTTEAILRDLAAQHRLKAGQLIGASRVGMTGRLQAPGIFDVFVALGREETVARLRRLQDELDR